MKPTILAVLDDPRDWQAIHRELASRYATDYEIICESSPLRALQRLDALRAAPDARVLIVLAAGQMAAMTGTEFLQQAHELHPHAKRVLLIPWSNRSTSKPVLRMISQGRFDRYANVPARSPDENLHLLVTEILRDWQQQHPDRPTVVTLIDEPWSPRSYQIRDLLQRGGLPFVFHSADSPAGAALLREIGHTDGPVPGPHPLRRAGLHQPHQRGDGACARRPARLDRGRLRPRRGRRRTGGTLCRRLCRVGGTTDSRRRSRVDRRSSEQ